jgi:chondroitin 4-sulfotransferase 11
MRRRELQFVHVPKTGGISVATALGLPLHGHFRLEPDRRFAFAFVRHPLDRLASAFAYLAAGGSTNQDAIDAYELLPGFAGDFGRFVEDLHARPERYLHQQHFRPQTYWLEPLERLHFLGRFERLKTDFTRLCKKIGRRAELPHLNQTWRTFAISAATAERVREVYAVDYERLGYHASL